MASTQVRCAAGLLVLSEVYDPAWQAEVDGKPVKVQVANHVLRAVAIPAGEHAVELRYQSPALQVGLAISLAGYLAITTILVAALRRRRGVEGPRRRDPVPMG